MPLNQLDVIKTRVSAYKAGEAERGNDWNSEGHPGPDFEWLFQCISDLQAQNDEYLTLAEAWMKDYDALAAKYEPQEIVASNSLGEVAEGWLRLAVMFGMGMLIGVAIARWTR